MSNKFETRAFVKSMYGCIFHSFEELEEHVRWWFRGMGATITRDRDIDITFANGDSAIIWLEGGDGRYWYGGCDTRNCKA